MASMAYPVIAFKPTSIACCARQFLPGVVGPSRADWQSTCAILSKESAIFHQQPEENNNKLVNIPALNGHIAPSDLELILISNLSRPLTIADHAPTPMHGSSIRVAYQGVPGAYSEAAAGRAYPNCEPIPCDQFEVAFQAVELWIADRAVLPVQPNVITGEFQFYPLNLNSLIINDRISGV